ncbi:hypothetical protein QJQ45_022077 [Haematococcus lacustris]|nr:hypothetical protein QJQ45_022077 [Haematococcus lacustris]
MTAYTRNNAHHAPLYYMGDYNADELQLDLDTASGKELLLATIDLLPKPRHPPLWSGAHDYCDAGPFPLDLGGATLYAPNLLTNDPLGRVVLWGWCQEIGRPAFADASAGSPSASSGPSDAAAAAAPEAAAAPDHESACCLSLPRLLWQHPTLPGRLWQEPLPAMSKLRDEVGSGSLASWQADKINLTPHQPHDLPPHLCRQSHLELEVTFDPPSCPVRKGRVAKSGLMLFPVPTDSQDSGETSVPIGEASGRHGAVLLFDWQEQRLDVVFNDGSVSLQQLAAMPMNRYRQLNSQSVVAVGPSPPSSPGHPTCSIDATEERARSCTPLMHHLHGTFEDDGGSSDDEAEVERRAINISGCHAVGGALHFAPANKSHAANKPAWQPITLRIFLDHSLLEVFTSTGEVLTSRVYRGARESQPVEPATSPMHLANKSVLQLVSVGVPCTARNVVIHQMSSIWHEPEALAALEQAAAAKVAAAATGAAEPSRPSASASAQVVAQQLEDEDEDWERLREDEIADDDRRCRKHEDLMVMAVLMQRRPPMRTVLMANDIDGQRLVDDDEYVRLFRMGRGTFDWLKSQLETRIGTRQLCAGQRLALALRYLASGATMRVVAADMGRGHATVHEAVHESTNHSPRSSGLETTDMALDTANPWKATLLREVEAGYLLAEGLGSRPRPELLPPQAGALPPPGPGVAKENEWPWPDPQQHMPTTVEELTLSASAFMTAGDGLPQCFAAVDGTHVAVKDLGLRALYNRKGFCSFNVQAVCNGEGLWIAVEVGNAGSMHDARAFSESSLGRGLQGVVGQFLWSARMPVLGTAMPMSILADSAYACSTSAGPGTNVAQPAELEAARPAVPKSQAGLAVPTLATPASESAGPATSETAGRAAAALARLAAPGAERLA